MLSKDFIVKANAISQKDAHLRLAEYKKTKSLSSKKENYPIEEMKSFWPEGTYFDVAHIEGLYGELDGKLLIIFRGTDGVKGMIHNFMWRKRRTSFLNDKKIRIANGFHRDYSTIRDFIIDVVNKSNNKDVVVHGHSKGGVLAALCALDIVSNTTDKNVEAFSIGMLRTGNKHFADYFDKKLPNYINIDYGSDFWSQLAPRWLGFHHVGKRIHLGPKRKWGFGRRKDHHWDVYHNALKEHLTDEMLKEDK